MDNYTPCGTSAAGSLLLVMVGNGRWCVGGVGGDFSHTGYKQYLLERCSGSKIFAGTALHHVPAPLHPWLCISHV